MRKGVADIRRRAQVAGAANARYLEALSSVGVKVPVSRVIDPISRRIVRDKRPYRALRPVDPAETRLFQIILQGKFLLSGFTNRQLREELAGKPAADPTTRRRESARITRTLRLLRAHQLIGKVPRTRYYRVSERGRAVMSVALAIRQANSDRLAA